MNEEEVNHNDNINSESAGRRNFQLFFSLLWLELLIFSLFAVQRASPSTEPWNFQIVSNATIEKILFVTVFVVLWHFYDTHLLVHLAFIGEAELPLAEWLTTQVQCAALSRFLRPSRRNSSDLFSSVFLKTLFLMHNTIGWLWNTLYNWMCLLRLISHGCSMDAWCQI